MLSVTILRTSDLTGYDLFLGCIILIIAVRSGIVIYRLFLHPLRSVPGPGLAAATSLYLRYHEVVEHGGLTKRLPHLHDLYKSPVIRIAPNHVHINEPNTYRKVFGTKPVFRKCGDFFGSSQGVHTIVTTDDPKCHRAMRSSASPLFSLREMTHSFRVGRSHVKRVTDSMAQEGHHDKQVDLHRYFLAMMVRFNFDVMMPLTGSRPILLRRRFFPFHQPVSLDKWVKNLAWRPREQRIDSTFIVGDIPFLVPIGLNILEAFPHWISAISIGFKDLYEHCKEIGNDLLLAARASGGKKSTSKYRTVLFLGQRPAQKLTSSDASSLLQQAAVFLLAGTSPAIALTVACFTIMKSERIKNRLRKELSDLESRISGGIFAPSFDWRELIRLPYLDAVIKESLRFIPPIPGLLPKVVPEEGMEIGEHSIPGGTRISAAQFVFHHNEDIFPNPGHFNPERWLQKSPVELQVMEQYFMPFSRGTRACIGWQHAYVYMFTTVAHIVSQFEMEPVESTLERLDWKDKTGAVPVAPPLVWFKPKKGS